MEQNNYEQRMAEVRSLFQTLSEDFGNEEASARLCDFVSDAEWEIRKVVAEAMAHVNPEVLCRFACLAQDRNAWVRRAAEDALRQNGIVLGRIRRRENSERADVEELNAFREKYGVKALQSVGGAYRRLFCKQIAGVGHDLRNLLTPLIDNTDGTLDILDRPGSPNVFGNLRKMTISNRETLKFMVKMVDDIRDLTMEVNMDGRMTVQLLALVQESWNCVSGCLGGRGLDMGKIRFECGISPDVTVFVVRERMVRVFSNLLKNAAESFLVSKKSFRAAGGTVSVTAEEQPEGVRITVADNGRGMAKAELESVRLFQPTGMSSKPDGTGYGMSIACAIVHGHGGYMDMESEQKKGTAVTVFLPNAEVADEGIGDR